MAKEEKEIKAKTSNFVPTMSSEVENEDFGVTFYLNQLERSRNSATLLLLSTDSVL